MYSSQIFPIPRFVLGRLAQSAFVMLAVVLIAFVLFRFVGDPVSQMVGQETSVEDRERLRERLGFTDPIPAQFVGNLVSGEFGCSYRTRQPIGEMIRDRLSSSALLLLTLVGVSVPTFVIGMALIYLFGVQLGWLPTFGRGETVAVGWWKTNFLTLDGWRALILPAITLGVYQLTLTMRLVRSEMLEVLRADYVKFATARGLPWRSIYYRHALRNSLVPVITIVGLQFGGVIACAVVTESVFQWSGLGLLFLESIQSVDIPVMSVYLVVIAFLFVVINLVVDLLYFAVDPRIRVAGVH